MFLGGNSRVETHSNIVQNLVSVCVCLCVFSRYQVQRLGKTVFPINANCVSFSRSFCESIQYTYICAYRMCGQHVWYWKLLFEKFLKLWLVHFNLRIIDSCFRDRQAEGIWTIVWALRAIRTQFFQIKYG